MSNSKDSEKLESYGYKNAKFLGKGTYGIVDVVENHKNGGLFAVKYIPQEENDNLADDGIINLTEIDIFSRIVHPHLMHKSEIITKFKCPDVKGALVVMPLAERTLKDIAKDQMLTTDAKIPILYKLATAIEYLHRNKILHLDIKTINVVIKDSSKNIPFLTDFDSCLVVDNIVAGKKDEFERVTRDFKPPEILNEGRVYNAAVDVWSFGICMLYVINGDRKIYEGDVLKSTNAEIYKESIKIFANTDFLDNHLKNVRDEYKSLCKDLLSKILVIDSAKRLTMKEVCDHALFKKFVIENPGRVIRPPINSDFPNDHRTLIKLCVHVVKTLFPEDRVEILFLAMELFTRVSSFYKASKDSERMTVVITCAWMASKLTDSKYYSCSRLVDEAKKIIPSANRDKILDKEIEIIHILDGILHNNSIYNVCNNVDELNHSFDLIMDKNDPTLYARIDLDKYRNYLDKHVLSKPSIKTISVAEFLN